MITTARHTSYRGYDIVPISGSQGRESYGRRGAPRADAPSLPRPMLRTLAARKEERSQIAKKNIDRFHSRSKAIGWERVGLNALWVDRPTTNSRKIVARVATPLSVAMELNVQCRRQQEAMPNRKWNRMRQVRLHLPTASCRDACRASYCGRLEG